MKRPPLTNQASAHLTEPAHLPPPGAFSSCSSRGRAVVDVCVGRAGRSVGSVARGVDGLRGEVAPQGAPERAVWHGDYAVAPSAAVTFDDRDAEHGHWAGGESGGVLNQCAPGDGSIADLDDRLRDHPRRRTAPADASEHG